MQRRSSGDTGCRAACREWSAWSGILGGRSNPQRGPVRLNSTPPCELAASCKSRSEWKRQSKNQYDLPGPRGFSGGTLQCGRVLLQVYRSMLSSPPLKLSLTEPAATEVGGSALRARREFCRGPALCAWPPRAKLSTQLVPHGAWRIAADRAEAVSLSYLPLSDLELRCCPQMNIGKSRSAPLPLRRKSKPHSASSGTTSAIVAIQEPLMRMQHGTLTPKHMKARS